MRKQNMNRDWTATARTLSEALPYLQRYSGAVVVVKFGGNAMGDDDAMAEFALVNKRIVQAINDAGGRAVGISGKDDDLMVCEVDDPELGFVGRPIEMNVQIIRDLYKAGLIPVIAPVATGMADNETFNVNGDTAAGAIAGALRADRLLLLTDVAGVKDANGEVLTQIHPDQVRQMIADGTIAGGMIPKTETALKALEEGVRAVVILDGRVPNASLLELFTEHGAGSLIRSTPPSTRPRGLRQGEASL